MITCSIGAEPMWCSGGHQEVISAVNTSKARSGSQSTTISRVIGSTVWLVRVSLMVGIFLEGRSSLERGQGSFPEAVEVLGDGPECFRVGAVERGGADLLIDDQAGLLEHLEVLGDGGATDGPAGGQLSRELPDGP